MDAVKLDPAMEIVIDVELRTLEAQAIDFVESFPLSDSVQHRFLNGLDDIALTLGHADEIGHFETHRPDWVKAARDPAQRRLRVSIGEPDRLAALLRVGHLSPISC